jgi:hypothetical protein
MKIPDLIFENFVLVFWVDADPDPGSCQPWIRDKVWKSQIRDPGSGINIPDPQHCFLATRDRYKSGKDLIPNNGSTPEGNFL